MACGWWDACLVACGLYYGCKIALLWSSHVIYQLKFHFFPWLDRVKLKDKYGPWAAVTGCTSGIGLGYARGFAREGMNLVLISRSLDKLAALAEAIEGQFGVQTRVMVSEAADRQTYCHISQQLSSMDIGVLVNNVATLSEEGVKPLRFHETSPARVLAMSTVNCGAASLLTHAVVPGMIRRGRGLVVNMSSIAAYYPVSFQAHYSATKIYLEMVGDSLKTELEGTNVCVKAIRPFIVQTQMTATNNLCYNFPLAQSPAHFISHVRPTLLSSNNTCGYWLPDFIMWTFTLWPEWMKYVIIHWTMSFGDRFGHVLTFNK